jgi:hypothetical protein
MFQELSNGFRVLRKPEKPGKTALLGLLSPRLNPRRLAVPGHGRLEIDYGKPIKGIMP